MDKRVHPVYTKESISRTHFKFITYGETKVQTHDRYEETGMTLSVNKHTLDGVKAEEPLVILNQLNTKL